MKKLWYEPKPRTWEEAQSFCKSKNGDLAIIESSEDMSDLDALDMNSFHAWVGLKKFTSGWLWQSGKEDSPIRDVFAEGQPVIGQECGKIIRKHEKAYTDNCEDKHFSFCEKPINTFHFVAETKTWAEALEHCLQKTWWFADFILSTNFGWSSAVKDPQHFSVWIGLHHDGAVWRWRNGTASHQQRWTSVGSRAGFCLAVTSHYNNPHAYNCSTAFPFICHRQNLVLVPEPLSWEDGLEVCTNISPLNNRNFNLASLEESDLQSVLTYTTEATTDKVWLGLRFLAGIWVWSDGAPLTLPSFQSLCPGDGRHCGALVLSTGSIEAVNCNEKLNLLCYA